MSQYPEVGVQQRDVVPRCDSDVSASATISPPQYTNIKKTHGGHVAPPHWTQFPSTSSTASLGQLSRNGSDLPTPIEDDAATHQIDADYARYTHASPPFSEDQYDGKTEDEQTHMRRVDYAKELKRMMGRQLVKGLKTDLADAKSP
jgi:hypothetical protein